MFRVVVHPQAKEDIARNANWWANHHSLDQAIAWVDAVDEQLQSLEERPERFGVAEENEHFPYEIRQMPVGVGSRRTHRAIYIIREEEVQVLTVRRGDQDTVRVSELPKKF